MQKIVPANGCEKIAASIILNFEKLLSSALVNDYDNVKRIACSIDHEANLLSAFFSQNVPVPINSIIIFCHGIMGRGRNSAESAELVKKVLPAFFELKKLDWSDFFNENMNYDSIFLTYAKEYKYNEILENLALHFASLLPPEYDGLTATQQEDVAKVIEALRLCKNKSESAIANCLHIADEILLILFPKLEILGKISELASELPEALTEAKTLLKEMVVKTKQKFLQGMEPRAPLKELETQKPYLQIERKSIAGLLDTGKSGADK